ncbi:hypothetical protein R3P38DRAFT_2780643 [Favolaschia claudopus]|uniref:DUF6534 domain-containing protein n=1 Tax=Favolaschia claudopus TaxID=2862362 RepID=A0AAW0BB13_9AGAR
MESCPDFDVSNTFGRSAVYGSFQSHKHSPSIVKSNELSRLGEIGQSISFAIALYTVLIINFGHPERLLPLSDVSHLQIFFAYRIYTLSRSLYIPILCWMLSLFRLIPSNVILFGGIHDPGEILNRWSTLFNAIWVVSALNDILVAGTMVVLLRERQAHVLERTSAVVDKLITWTIETGMVTSIIMVVVFLTLRTTLVWLAIWVVIPRRCSGVSGSPSLWFCLAAAFSVDHLASILRDLRLLDHHSAILSGYNPQLTSLPTLRPPANTPKRQRGLYLLYDGYDIPEMICVGELTICQVKTTCKASGTAVRPHGHTCGRAECLAIPRD